MFRNTVFNFVVVDNYSIIFRFFIQVFLSVTLHRLSIPS